eukprot:m.196373 g.196373  ORF g.196373 m.196373 type:complete len:66 (+) comp32619_c2_seq1:107-304(+)
MCVRVSDTDRTRDREDEGDVFSQQLSKHLCGGDDRCLRSFSELEELFVHGDYDVRRKSTWTQSRQ